MSVKRKCLVTLWCLAASAGSANALTIHRSFTQRDIGFGGGASVSVPVDAKVSKAIDEGRQAVRKERTIVGRVTRVYDGDTLLVTPNGSSGTKVRLLNVDAPEADQSGGGQAKAFLKGLVCGQKVEVKYAERDDYGRVLGTVYYKSAKGLVDVNLTLVVNGWAWYEPAFGTNNRLAAYDGAERAARNAKTGLWSEPNPIRPCDWRKRTK